MIDDKNVYDCSKQTCATFDVHVAVVNAVSPAVG